MFGEDFFSSLTQYGEKERPKKPNSPSHNRYEWLQNHKFKEWPETLSKSSCTHYCTCTFFSTVHLYPLVFVSKQQ